APSLILLRILRIFDLAAHTTRLTRHFIGFIIRGIEQNTMTEYTNVCYTEEEKARIQLQLDRLLANVHFSNSKRFPSFLRFIIHEELEGRGDQLKERTLGIEVFNRDASYDTTSDPIVRVTAAEIRKRIAQYYQESGHADELRISLPPGSYVPHFDWPHTEPTSAAPLEVVASPATSTQPLPLPPLIPTPSGHASRSRLFVAVPLLLVLIAAG